MDYHSSLDDLYFKSFLMSTSNRGGHGASLATGAAAGWWGPPKRKHDKMAGETDIHDDGT